ncbi:hypothetical protein Micbo1qcDRAFT_8429 [Microdochium bolleyi]|uniref:LysM domain-containing protein n=1 Tax=Microdochium bolleyi TaxID=196109 RepID=A0A136JK52_9PEZI|nr:hypothetical protein Micbo1qcDRAFT_8429 [Microdochium bolleyi]
MSRHLSDKGPPLSPTDLESCCTCATLLSQTARYSISSEKPLPPNRSLECCPRVICGACIHKNPRFSTYCPYCQISQTTSSLPPGLKEPPSYDSVAAASHKNVISGQVPPPYAPSSRPNASAARDASSTIDEKSVPSDDEGVGQDVLHFLRHPDDTVSSLSLRYGVPADILRRANNIHADHLLLARRAIMIPGQYYKGGISLSPRPVDGEEEELRKAKIRRWMVACKVHEYDIAVLYLEQADYDLDAAVEAYLADEEWERRNPANGARRGKGFVRARPLPRRISTGRR